MLSQRSLSQPDINRNLNSATLYQHLRSVAPGSKSFRLHGAKIWRGKCSPRYLAITQNYEFTCINCGGGDKGRVAIYRPFGEVSLSLNRTVTCMVLKANDRRTSCPCHDEFRGPRSDYVRQVALATTTTTGDLKLRYSHPNATVFRVGTRM
ncbi:uncharacterized protein TNCV_2279431 [Trichonephila clavipes]|uniref:Uncharacterized protein n=1 Tax=Trichonephila clavipes TaxID=2585209 RepID=A0A8X6R5H4_TRICX|nr:uncharacterized protein TNCV_2279431 [Trichonephila clavipes]